MKTIYFTELDPIFEMCSIMVNIDGPLDTTKIEESILLAIAIEKFGHFVETGKWKYTNEETEKKILSLKMEMIMRNIMLNDEFACKLTDAQLLGYLMGKAYLLTRHHPPISYIKSVIKVYRGFLNAREKLHDCIK